MKKTSLLFIVLLGFSNYGLSKNQNRVENILEILNEIRVLADEFNLTSDQKSQVHSVLMNYLPNIVVKTSAMINNRKNLLASNLSVDPNNDKYMLEIAKQQGFLLTAIIISKEHMKNDIKQLLTDEQQNFVEDLITTIIQYRINYS